MSADNSLAKRGAILLGANPHDLLIQAAVDYAIYLLDLSGRVAS